MLACCSIVLAENELIVLSSEEKHVVLGVGWLTLQIPKVDAEGVPLLWRQTMYFVIAEPMLAIHLSETRLVILPSLVEVDSAVYSLLKHLNTNQIAWWNLISILFHFSPILVLKICFSFRTRFTYSFFLIGFTESHCMYKIKTKQKLNIYLSSYKSSKEPIISFARRPL